MKRLTVMTPKGAALKMDDTYSDEGAARADLMRRYRAAVDRLAAYEDTGLEPEGVEQIKLSLMGKSLAEIKELEGVPLGRMIELARAEKDGRLVVLPCKVGDMVYRVFHVEGREPVIDECEIKTMGQAADLIGRIGKKSHFVSVFFKSRRRRGGTEKEGGGRQ